MRSFAFGLVAAVVLSTAAMAQPTPPPTPPSPNPASPGGPATGPSAPPGERAGPPRPPGGGPGAFIRLKAPNGAEIQVRCAEGESTRTCADIVEAMAQKLMNQHRERMRETMGRREMGRGGGDMDDDHEDRGRDHPPGDRYRGWQ